MHISKTKEYRKWIELKTLCNPHSKKYRGLSLCDEWLQFHNFKLWWNENYIHNYILHWESNILSPDTCMFLDKKSSVKIKSQQTSIAKYGDVHFSKTNEYKDTLKSTLLNKYGVDHNSKIDNVIEKRKQSFNNKTIEEKNTIQQKREETNLRLYGVKHPGQLQTFVDKKNQTCISKYGTSTPQRLEIIKSKTIQTNLSKYGVEHPLRLQFYKNKVKQTNLVKYGSEWYSQTNKFKKDLLQFRINSNKHHTPNNQPLLQGLKDNNIKRCYSTALVYYKRFGKNYLNYIKDNNTAIENSIKIFLQSLSIPFEEKKYIKGVYPDFIIKDIIIECDGLYWHSEEKVDKKYHLKKKQIYDSLGYKSFFFREDEILQKPHIVQSIIYNALKLNKMIYARQCHIKKISSKEASIFCNNNHLMGSGQGTSYALIFNNEIVSVIRIRKIKDGVDISRFCNKVNTSVTGGFSKLIKHIERDLKPNFIQTFIDQRYGSGSYLTNLGFELQTNNLSFMWTKNNKTLHRLHFPSNSGYKFGYKKIWDCGQAKWIKICSSNTV